MSPCSPNLCFSPVVLPHPVYTQGQVKVLSLHALYRNVIQEDNEEPQVELLMSPRKTQASKNFGCFGGLSCIHHEDIVVNPQRAIPLSRLLAVVLSQRAHNRNQRVATEPFVFSVGAHGAARH